MIERLEQLEENRTKLYQKMASIKDFRPGMISVRYRKCGKKNCACAQPGHGGHGPQYLWSTSQNGKNRGQNLRLGPELEKTQKEIENYQAFKRLCQETIEVNEKICRLRPVPQIEDQDELAVLKKKLQRKFSRKQRAK